MPIVLSADHEGRSTGLEFPVGLGFEGTFSLWGRGVGALTSLNEVSSRHLTYISTMTPVVLIRGVEKIGECLITASGDKVVLWDWGVGEERVGVIA